MGERDQLVPRRPYRALRDDGDVRSTLSCLAWPFRLSRRPRLARPRHNDAPRCGACSGATICRVRSHSEPVRADHEGSKVASRGHRCSHAAAVGRVVIGSSVGC